VKRAVFSPMRAAIAACVPRAHHHIVFFCKARKHNWEPSPGGKNLFYQVAACRALSLPKCLMWWKSIGSQDF
jgi:hypothetical protein